MATPKAHMEEIRKTKFSIGREEANPLTEDLHQAVKNLSAELYVKDVHFLMELIQNAEDNEYPEGVDPSLEFVITSRDITAAGAPATLTVFNNEKGFSLKNIESICSVGRSTKKGNRKRGYIGEKVFRFANSTAFLVNLQILLHENAYSLPEAFRGKLSRAWLKTHVGYHSPDQCLLFDSKSHLKQTDGPFIDEEFYGSKLTTYRKELAAIGVIVEVKKGCALIARHLDLHDEFSTFVRVHSYLSDSKWVPLTDGEAPGRIWVLKENKNGEWVSADECVLYDKDGLFGLLLTVLEKHYEQKLFGFFSSAFGIRSHPSVDDYLNLWKVWESSESGLSHDQCCMFWLYVSNHWNLKMEKSLADAVVKVPVYSGSGGILLCNKEDVFVADDLQLQYLFKQFSQSIFVWYPQPSLASFPQTRLLEIYKKIGVRSISESVKKVESSLADDVELLMIPTKKLIGKTLLRLILGFLAGPPIEMEVEKRQEAVQGLVDIAVVETPEPITVSYDLPLSSGEVLNVRGTRKIRWDRENSKFFIQKMDKSGGQKSTIEFATYFAEAISECVLWECTEHIPALSELIKLVFVLEFNEEAVDFLMKSKNLQIFVEDAEFLNSAYPSI
ncbi:hypothetical protein ACFX11_038852 [Malus domestica]